MSCLLAAALLLAAAAPSRAAWARFQVADFPTTARHPGIVAFDDGPALVVLESERLHVLRRSTAGWTQSTVTPDSGRRIYGFTACDGRGDGVRRLYLSFLDTPRVWEVTPHGARWTVDEFSPHGERPTEHGNSGPLACAASSDGRPSLFVTNPDRKRLLECRWKKRWTCAASIRDENIQGPLRFLHADPPGWETPDLLFFQGALAARGPDGWRIVPEIDTNSYPEIILSRTKPRAFYSFGQRNLEISLDRNLAVIERKEMTPLMAGETAAVLRTEPRERIYGAAGEKIFEYREEGGSWLTSVISTFTGTQAYQVRAGDAHGDGVDRLYVLETHRPSSTPSRLWELVHYPSRDAVETPDPAGDALPEEGRRLLGELLRAELGRPGGLDAPPAASTAAYRLVTAVSADRGSYEIKAVLMKTDGAVLKELNAPATRAGLPAAMRALALRVAEAWPLWTASP